MATASLLPRPVCKLTLPGFGPLPKLRGMSIIRLCLALALAPAAALAADTKELRKDAETKVAKAESSQTDAGGSKQLAETGRVIVTAADASVQLQDADPKPLPPGTVLTYSIVNGPWIWSDQHWGWVNRADVVDLDDAAEHFTTIFTKAREQGEPGYPEMRSALHHRGIARLALGDFEAALEDLTEATERGLNTSLVYVNIATARRELGDLEGAMEAATEAIKIDDNALAYMARARVLYDQGYYEASLKDSDRAIELDDQNAEAFNARGVTKRILGQWRPAAEDYTRALKIQPRHRQALANRGYVLKKLGRLEEAVRDYQRSLKIDQNQAVVHNDLAWLLATAGDETIRTPGEAVRHAERAVELEPEDGRFLDTLAAAYAAAGDFGKAVDTGLKAVKLLTEAEQYEADQRVDLYADGKPYIEK